MNVMFQTSISIHPGTGPDHSGVQLGLARIDLGSFRSLLPKNEAAGYKPETSEVDQKAAAAIARGDHDLDLSDSDEPKSPKSPKDASFLDRQVHLRESCIVRGKKSS